MSIEIGGACVNADVGPDTYQNHPVASGIGRKFTDAELEEYLQRKAGGKPKDAAKVKRDLKNRIAKKAPLK